MISAWDRATADLDPPFAIVDLDAFDANLDDLLARAGGLPIRLATKSLRCRALVERAVERPGVAGLMCYSLREALWHAEHGTSGDVLVGYPTVDRAALRRLADGEHAVTLMVDSVAHLELIEAAVGAGHRELRVCLDLDAAWRPLPGVHVGARRSPVRTPAAAAALARAVAGRAGFRLVGLMAYEGQIAGVPDATGSRARDAAVRWMQARSARELAGRRGAVVRAVREVAGDGALEFVNGGGSGSVETTRADPSVTEIAAGSALIGSTLFDGYTRMRPRPAVAYALPVVRRPDRRTATLAGGGWVASGPAAGSRLPTPFGPGDLVLTGTEGAGEVQTPVRGRRVPALGERVWMRHAKAGELAEHVTEYHLVRDGEIVRTVPTYRGEGQAFG